MASETSRSYGYDRFNRLVNVLQTGSNVMSLDYDAAGRLATTAAGASPTDATTSQYLYDGDQPILELTGLGAIRRRFVPGPGLDNVIVQIDHDGGGVPERRWMLSDDLGSIAALTDRTGKAIRFNAYGPFGEPSSGNIGRMGYAGALTLPEIGMVHLRARAYAPNLGRFIQPDPIGTAGGINLYAYAGGDPMNAIDPLGLMAIDDCDADVCVTGRRPPMTEECEATRGGNCSVLRGAPLLQLPELDLPSLAREIQTIIVSACREEGPSRCDTAGEQRDEASNRAECQRPVSWTPANDREASEGPLNSVIELQQYVNIATRAIALYSVLERGGEVADLATWNRKTGLTIFDEVGSAIGFSQIVNETDRRLINLLRQDQARTNRRILKGC